ncbi:MAG: SH3 domain-containing protein [Betaproteobacteria bacterium]|nr:SH3 domain-containing protein [Betaproteobacteria bacterium]
MKTVLAAALFAFSLAAAESLVLRAPGILYDGPSAQAAPLFILTAGYPLREISRVDGWRKVGLPDGENGWVRDNLAQSKRAAVVVAELAAARFSPSADAAEVFYARKGVALEVLGESGGWTEVRHQDGETGYMRAADLWTN